MKQEDEVVYLKIFDEKKGDVVFEGKVSIDVKPHELVFLGRFWERRLRNICNKETNKEMMSFKGLQNNVELVAVKFAAGDFSGVLYVGADDGVVRNSKTVPSCECVKMSMCCLSHEECEKVFKCDALEELEMYRCKLMQVSSEIGGMKKLKKIRLERLNNLKSILEEIGELLSLQELWIGWCEIEGLPKRLKDLKMLKSIALVGLSDLQLNAEDVVLFSKLKRLTITTCEKAFLQQSAQSFWEMIKSTTDLRVLDLTWDEHNQEMVAAALEENGSIVDRGWGSDSCAHILKRNEENHERALQCVVHLLAIRRWRNALHYSPKEMVKMISMMLWNTKCDVEAWRISDKQAMKKTRNDE